MSIPDPTVDSVTGLPILDTSGIVQQIPLGNQTTDFASWNATAQPTRTPIFPDDGFPMFANVQGQHPLTGNAQTIESDGEHRLKVAIDGGGGGSTSATYATTNGPTVATLCDADSRTFLDDLSAATTIYGVTWWAALDPAATPVLRDVTYRVYLAPSAHLSHHVFCGFGGWSIVAAGITADLKGDSRTVLFPVPINRALTWPAAADVLLVFEAANGAIFCGGSGITG